MVLHVKSLGHLPLLLLLVLHLLSFSFQQEGILICAVTLFTMPTNIFFFFFLLLLPWLFFSFTFYFILFFLLFIFFSSGRYENLQSPSLQPSLNWKNFTYCEMVTFWRSCNSHIHGEDWLVNIRAYYLFIYWLTFLGCKRQISSIMLYWLLVTFLLILLPYDFGSTTRQLEYQNFCFSTNSECSFWRFRELYGAVF